MVRRINHLTAIGLGVFSSATSGTLEYVMSGGISGWIPLIAGVGGIVLAYTFFIAVPPLRRALVPSAADIGVRQNAVSKLAILWNWFITTPDRHAFASAPRSVRLAAALIAKQLTSEGAVRVFEIWNAQEDNTDFVDIYSAMSSLHYRLGDNEKGERFATLVGWEKAYTGEDF